MGFTAFDLSGPPNAPAIVLIHGLGLTRALTWAQIGPALAERYRVLRYDLPGHGDSALPDGPVSLSSLADQLVNLMDQTGIAHAALVGFSLGGMINRRVAMDHPDRVAALAILNSPHERDPARQTALEDRVRNTGTDGPSAGLDDTLARWFTKDFRRDQPRTVEQVRQIVLANDPANYAAHLSVLVSGVTELIRPAPPISHPTLVLTCENDSGSSPQMARTIGSEIAGADINIVPGLQHLGLIEEPALFSEAVRRFLDALPRW